MVASLAGSNQQVNFHTQSHVSQMAQPPSSKTKSFANQVFPKPSPNSEKGKLLKDLETFRVLKSELDILKAQAEKAKEQAEKSQAQAEQSKKELEAVTQIIAVGFSSIFQIKVNFELAEKYVPGEEIVLLHNSTTGSMSAILKNMKPIVKFLKDHPDIVTCHFSTLFSEVRDLPLLAAYQAQLIRKGKKINVTFADANLATAYKKALSQQDVNISEKAPLNMREQNQETFCPANTYSSSTQLSSKVDTAAKSIPSFIKAAPKTTSTTQPKIAQERLPIDGKKKSFSDYSDQEFLALPLEKQDELLREAGILDQPLLQARKKVVVTSSLSIENLKKTLNADIVALTEEDFKKVDEYIVSSFNEFKMIAKTKDLSSIEPPIKGGYKKLYHAALQFFVINRDATLEEARDYISKKIQEKGVRIDQKVCILN